MANLFSLKAGKLFSFVGKLADGGVTAEMAGEIDRNPALVVVVVEALRHRPEVRAGAPGLGVESLVRGLFTPLMSQLAQVRKLNLECGWGFTDVELTAAENSVPK